MEAITIPRGFKVTPEKFEQLAEAEQLARLELSKISLNLTYIFDS